MTDTSNLTDLANKLLNSGPLKVEPTTRRVRVLFDGKYIVDTTAAKHVWEHKWYPQFYVPAEAVVSGALEKGKAVDSDGCAFFGTVKSSSKSTDRILIFEKGPLAGLVRLEFGSMDAWFEEDLPIYVHPKDPYVRVDILPTSRHVKAVIDGVAIAESSNNMFLFETNLRARYYMPKTSVRWDYLTESDTSTSCPYKGDAKYYNVTVNGKTYKDVIWWYKTTTNESAAVAGHLCFYNEKVEIYIDGAREEAYTSHFVPAKGAGK